MFDTFLNIVRYALYLALLVLSLFLVQAWQHDHPAPVEAAPTTMPATTAIPGSHAPDATMVKTDAVQPASQPEATPLPASNTGSLINVTTDVIQATIDTRGGDVIDVKLLKYPATLHSNTPFTLLNNDPKTEYIAESGLLSTVGPDTATGQALYTVDKTTYTLQPNQNNIVVNLHWQHDGLNVTKSYTFTRNSYEVRVGYAVDNQSNQTWQGNLYTQLLRTNIPPESNGGMVNLTTYFGAAVSSVAKPFQKVTFKEMGQKPLNLSTQNGWAAMIQHYFISAWVPPKNTTSTYYSKVNDGLYTIGMIGQPLTAGPGVKMNTETKLYTGPAIADRLEQTAPNLKLTIDYGWFWFISAIIFWMLQKIYDVVGNWGWSIVLVTIVIKLMFYQLSAKSYRSMNALKRLQPKVEAIKSQHGDDRQKLTQATMELYKKEKVSPLSGCLPILVQIPVFIALYWVLVESVQLRHAPFILWIHDLSVHDPYYILPLLMGVSMFVQQKMNPPPADPLQAKLMMLMPVIFTVLFANFPAGLMLYWFVNNSLSVLQQWHIMYAHEKATGSKR